MDIAPFETEHFFAEYEFTTPHPLSLSDCESVSIGELLELGGSSLEEFGGLRLGYTEPLGHPELREAIAAADPGLSVDQVMVLGSPIEGIDILCRAVLDPGDEVVVLTPCYDALRNAPEHIGKILEWPLRAVDGGWEMDLDHLDRLLARSPRLVMANFPHNPTGFQPRPDELREVVARVERSGALLYCDEMYRGLEFGERERLPCAATLSDRVIVLAGLSKSSGLPGLRSGWLLVSDPELRAKLENWKYYTSICPPAPSMFLAHAAFRARDELLRRNLQIVRDNLERAQGFFARHAARFDWRPPQAGSVALVGVDVPSATEWCHRLARGPGVLLLPGSCLGAGDDQVRFGFGRRSFGPALEALDRELQTGASLGGC